MEMNFHLLIDILISNRTRATYFEQVWFHTNTPVLNFTPSKMTDTILCLFWFVILPTQIDDNEKRSTDKVHILRISCLSMCSSDLHFWGLMMYSYLIWRSYKYTATKLWRLILFLYIEWYILCKWFDLR